MVGRRRIPRRQHHVGLEHVERVVDRARAAAHRSRGPSRRGDPGAGGVGEHPHAVRSSPARAPRPTGRRARRSSPITRRRRLRSSPGVMSPAIRHHWLRSTMISSASPPPRGSRGDDGDAGASPSRAIRTLTALKPCWTSAAASVRARAGRAQLAEGGVHGSRSTAPRAACHRRVERCPARSHSAASRASSGRRETRSSPGCGRGRRAPGGYGR